MTRTIFTVALVAMFVVAGCSRSLTPEEQAQAQALRLELDATKKEVLAAEALNAQYAGGVIKTLVALRLEILKINEALIQQRIHAIESGAKVTIETLATKSDPERAKQLEAEMTTQGAKVAEAEAKARTYSGGLVGVMAHMSAVTEQNSLAMLRQQYLIAKYGLALASAAGTPAATTADVPKAPAETHPTVAAEQDVREQIFEVTLLKKQYAKPEYQDYIYFDAQFVAKGLDKPTRAIKGVLRLTDLFGEQKFALKWTIDKPIAPGATYTEKGSGFEYNQFNDAHQWVRATERENMKAVFRVDSIIYADGTTRDFE